MQVTDSVHLYRVNGRRKVEQVCSLLTQRRQEARTQKGGGSQGKDGLETLTRREKLLSNQSPCVLAPLRLCVAAVAVGLRHLHGSWIQRGPYGGKPCGVSMRKEESAGVLLHVGGVGVQFEVGHAPVQLELSLAEEAASSARLTLPKPTTGG